jgi:nucleoside 2-deoxyribosyltransferase
VTQGRLRIYLAGPEVFLPDAVAVGAAKRALCASFGFTGLYALEPPEVPAPDAAPFERAATIFRNCIAQMNRADLAIANLTPFRGTGADPGTAFEVGYMVAAGKRVFGYTNVAASLEARVRDASGGRLEADADGGWRDADGLAVEPFGLAENLMLACASTAPIVVHDAPSADRFRDLTAFRRCLEQVKAALG